MKIRYFIAGSAVLAALAAGIGCPMPSDLTLLQPPPPWTADEFKQMSIRDLCRLADRTQDAWGEQARHPTYRLQNDAAIKHAERLEAIFKEIETRNADATWKAYSRRMQREARRVKNEEIGTTDIREYLGESIYLRCLGCHEKFLGPFLPTEDYRKEFGHEPKPAGP
jgi:hypothetical protein